MSNEVFVMLIMFVSVLVSLTTEALKKAIGNKEISNNLLVGVPSVIISLVVGICYCILNSITITYNIVIYIIALIFISWLCAMLGYDKVIQTLKQIKE